MLLLAIQVQFIAHYFLLLLLYRSIELLAFESVCIRRSALFPVLSLNSRNRIASLWKKEKKIICRSNLIVCKCDSVGTTFIHMMLPFFLKAIRKQHTPWWNTKYTRCRVDSNQLSIRYVSYQLIAGVVLPMQLRWACGCWRWERNFERVALCDSRCSV